MVSYKYYAKVKQTFAINRQNIVYSPDHKL